MIDTFDNQSMKNKARADFYFCIFTKDESCRCEKEDLKTIAQNTNDKNQRTY